MDVLLAVGIMANAATAAPDKVYVDRDEPDFISLVHVVEMRVDMESKIRAALTAEEVSITAR